MEASPPGQGRRRPRPPRRRRPARRPYTEAEAAARRAAVPPIAYPPELPVAARVDDLAAAIADHQVVVVAGETGSGKSTQLPKICLGLGRGVTGMIGHTQPRRIAARALAERIAFETGTEVGGPIGYAVRFGDHTGPQTLVKLMTDGILLAEIASDPELTRYDTIIIDEAHERSLNIDFLLGYLKRLLPRRPDLKLIITSATIDPEKFAAHFDGAPIVEVSGRTYPVEIRYRPYGIAAVGTAGGGGAGGDGEEDVIDDADHRGAAPAGDGDQEGAILDAVDELFAAGDGDILVFLAGEREITDTADALRAHLTRRGGLAAATEVLPLYGRLSMADQHKVFAPSGRRRIVLATNVAETSLTVPGIRYVIDPGTARISRYSTRTKVQRLPIEKISQASAGQRAGRCGRVADGIAIRLYAEDDFVARDEYTDPEIARTSLAAVILAMAALGLGDVEGFPFLDPPDDKQISDGIAVLAELGALADGAAGSRRSRGRSAGRRDQGSGSGARMRLTATGRAMARIPADPRLARMIVEADRRGCLAEILVIVAALTVRDVREYPLDDREAAAAAHARFADKTSDFLGQLNLWRYLSERRKELSGNAFRRLCRTEHLHYLRYREWLDLHGQLRSTAKALGMDVRASAYATETGYDSAAIHTSLAAGLLSHLAARIDREPSARNQERQRGRRARMREYQGTRGTTLAIWPGSALAKNPPPLVIAAEIVETSRAWARTVAAVEPGWIEAVGGPLLRRTYSEPYFAEKRQAVLAAEKVLLLGVTLVAARPVQYDRIDRPAARELFLRDGLVAGRLRTHLPFLAANQAALDEVAESERRTRRTGIVIDDETLFELYDARIPEDVTSTSRLESWWRRAAADDPGLLAFTPDLLIAAGAELAAAELYPDRIDADGVDVGLDYVFSPGAADDGVSATVPLAALATLDPASFPAQVPGLRRELAVALIRSLPKGLRRAFVPAPDFADAALAAIGTDTGALPGRLAEQLTRLGGVPVAAADFDPAKVPDHLRMTFTVVDDSGRTVAAGKDLSALRRELGAQTRRAVARVSAAVERTGLTAFPVDGVPEVTRGEVAGAAVTGYPALVDEGDTVGLTVFAERAAAERAMRGGMRRLLLRALTDEIDALAGTIGRLTTPRGPGGPSGRSLSRAEVLVLTTAPHGTLAGLVADAAAAAIDALYEWAGAPARTAPAFAAVRAKIAGQLSRAVTDILGATADVLRAAGAATAAIDAAAPRLPAETVAALRAELSGWLRPGMIADIGAAHLPAVQRYCAALEVRAGRIADNRERDARRAAEIDELVRALERRIAGLAEERRGDEDVRALRRMIAEYRIAVFAQPMKAAIPVSAQRILAAIDALPD